MFSVLQPKTRIPPHTGVSNTRLVVHLALVIPEGCGFRVGNETRDWRAGEAFVFDDTLEHEAWNESDRTRTVLIFDIWSPFLSEPERDLIRRVTAAADEFNGGAAGGAL
jgi:aspartyl/asparaginyl beta-hydroxylase (cupin superfamily)